MSEAGVQNDLYAFLHPAGAIGLVTAERKDALIRSVEGWLDPRASEAQLLVAEEIAEFGDDVRPDGQGRIVFAKHLCEYGEVALAPRDEVVWRGRGAWCELWRRGRREEQLRRGRYLTPVGCEWDDADRRALMTAFESTMRRVGGGAR